ncbi:MAG: HU family DNA-binding protein, partial [Prevotella sp.]
MSKLNLYDLCGVLVSKNGLEDKEARRFVQAMFDIIQEGLDEDKIVKVKGLGTFKIIDVDARESINVNTGGRVLIEGHSKVTFTPDSVMKEIVNKPFSQFETVVLNDGVDFPETPEDEASGEAEESTAAPVVDKKPEPVVEKAPEPVVENKPEPVVETTPSDENKSESIVGAAPAAETASSEETTSVDESAPVENTNPVEDTNPVEEPNPDVDENFSETEEEEGKITYRWLMYCAAVLLLVVAAAYGGYLYGKYEISEEIAHKQMLADLKAAEETTKKATVESMKDTTAQEVDATKIGAISTEKIKQETKNDKPTADKSTADKSTADKTTAD